MAFGASLTKRAARSEAPLLVFALGHEFQPPSRQAGHRYLPCENARRRDRPVPVVVRIADSANSGGPRRMRADA